MNHKVEICTDTFKSVENAANAGATRIELCSALDLGGLTPSISFARLALSKTNIKVNVLIRPRPGNFVYSDDEFSIICQDIQIFKELGVNGIVCGVLTTFLKLLLTTIEYSRMTLEFFLRSKIIEATILFSISHTTHSEFARLIKYRI